MDLIDSTWSLPLAVGAFGVGAAAVAIFGWRLANVVDRLADRTGLGEALAGALLLASATSLAGLMVTVVAALDDDASLAVSNAVGGIAAQTAFIVVADLVYRRANLERAAASLTNIFNTLAMISLLALVVVGATAPPWTILGVHPVTPVLFLVYAYGVRLAREIGQDPMWAPARTPETRPDVPDETPAGESLRALWGRFALSAAIVAVAGWLVARAGLSIVERTALSGTFVGAFFTSVVTSLPELVTTVAAVRAGALTLAVGGIVGGNTFDVLFVAVADIAFQDGSLYARMTGSDLFVVGWTILMAGVLAAGLIRRERGRVGFEGVAIIVVYVGGLLTVLSMS